MTTRGHLRPCASGKLAGIIAGILQGRPTDDAGIDNNEEKPCSPMPASEGAKPKRNTQKLTDANGLYLEVRPTGARLWRYRYRLASKENVYAIGAYPGAG